MNSLSGLLVESFVGPLGIIFEAFWIIWEYFGGAVGSLFELKSVWRSKGAQRGATLFSNSPFWTPFGALSFLNVFSFLLKRAVLKWVAVFLRCFGHPERSKGWARMQSVHAGAVETHFFIFAYVLENSSQQTCFGVHFGWSFRRKSQPWVKKGFQKMI